MLLDISTGPPFTRPPFHPLYHSKSSQITFFPFFFVSVCDCVDDHGAVCDYETVWILGETSLGLLMVKQGINEKIVCLKSFTEIFTTP